MDLKCICGGKLKACSLFTGMPAMTQSVTVPDGYAFPKTYSVNAFICEKCGRLELYADISKKGEN